MRTVQRLLVAAALGWVGWSMLFLWGRDRTTASWWCGSEACGSNDLAAVAPLVGAVACVLLVPTLVRFLDKATVGTVLTVAGFAAWSGLQQSVEDGLTTAGESEAWSTRMLVLMVVGGVLAVVGGARSLHQGGLLLRLLGRASAPARIAVRQTGTQKTVSVVFRSSDGQVHDVPLSKVPRTGSRRVVALYDPVQPGWPGRVSVGSVRAPRSADARAAWARRLADDLPAVHETPGVASGRSKTTVALPTAAGNARPRRPATPPSGGAPSRAEQIQHLDALRAAGQVTTAQADRAAAQVVADLFRTTFPTVRR